MTDLNRVYALDGHDGAGKTTLARGLADRLNAAYQRPFHGALGAALLQAAEQKDQAKVIALGQEGIESALTAAGADRPIILDRGWITVASLVDWQIFNPAWHYWIPTALCWADLATTLQRLEKRKGELSETIEYHQHYLGVYQSLAECSGSFVVRTDHNSADQCLDLLTDWVKGSPAPPRHPNAPG
jgi:thymidylate kinase